MNNLDKYFLVTFLPNKTRTFIHVLYDLMEPSVFHATIYDNERFYKVLINNFRRRNLSSAKRGRPNGVQFSYQLRFLP